MFAALIVLTVAAYLPLWENGFVDLDDDLYITRNPQVLQGLTWTGFRWAWTTFHGTYWQPLSWLSLQADAELFSIRLPGEQPVLSAAAFHAENLLWHGASVVLLFGLWQRLTGARCRSFLVAALFAVHPLRVESVAWAAERKDVLSCFFGILTLWAYIVYLEKPGWQRYLGLFTAYLLSLLCKPMLMTLPFVLLLLDYWPLCRTSFAPRSQGRAGAPRRKPVSLGRLLLEKVPLFALMAGIMVITLIARFQTWSGISYRDLPLFDRLANAATAYGWYLYSTIYPLHLAVQYPHRHGNWSVPAALAGAATVLALTLLCWRHAGRRPWLIVGWLWFVGTLVPVLGLAQEGEQAWADRFTYWPHIGLLVAIVWGLGEIVDRLRLPAAIPALAGVLALGLLTMLTWTQVTFWRDPLTLWEHSLAVTDNNYLAHLGLGTYYQAHGRPDEAATHFAECVRICPASAYYRLALGGTLHQLGKEDEAAVQYREAVERDPDYRKAWHNLGIVRLRQGQPAEADRCFRKVLDLQPDANDALAGLGEALWHEGKRQEAVQAFEEVLRRDPGSADAWHGLGTAYLTQGNPAKAVEALERALQLKPQWIVAYNDLGVALGRQDRWSDAARCYATAVQLQYQLDRIRQKMKGRPAMLDSVPQIVFFQCRLGFALHQLGNREAAARVYEEASQRDPEWPGKFAAKARALATAPDGNFRDPRLAYEMASQAIQAVSNPTATMSEALAAAKAALGR